MLGKRRLDKAFMNTKKISRVTLVLIVLIFLLALFLRLLAFMDFKDQMKLQYDPRNYWLMSHQIADDGVYGYYYYDDDGNTTGGMPGQSNARVMPGYPVFLALVYKILGDKYLQITAVRLIQIFANSLSCVLAFYFVRKVFKKDSAALLTALAMAVYPTYIFSCVQLLTEPLALFTFLLYLCLVINAIESGRTGLNLLAGFLFGAHILIRPAILPLFVLPFIFALITNKINGGSRQNRLGFRNISKCFVLQLIGLVAIMLPWWVRNIITLGEFIITAGASGNPFLGGTYPYFKDYFADVPAEIRGNNDKQMELGIKRFIEGFKTEPWLYFKWYTLGKIGHIFGQPYLLKIHAHTQIIHSRIHWLVLVLGIPGIIWHSLKSINGFWFYLYGLGILALQLLFVPDPRFAYLMLFFVMTGASHFIVFVCELTRKNKNKVEALP